VAHPVWYGLDKEPAGHVVIRMPDGSVYSTSDLTNTPHHHPDLADLERYYAYYGMNLTYRGWTEDVQGIPVITDFGLAAQGTIKTGGLTVADIDSITKQLADIQAKLAPISTSTGDVDLRQFIADGTRAAQAAKDQTSAINTAAGQVSLKQFVADGTRAAHKAVAQAAAMQEALKAVVAAAGSGVDLAAVTAAAEAGAEKALSNLTVTIEKGGK
jgi:hypothetical protein